MTFSNLLRRCLFAALSCVSTFVLAEDIVIGQTGSVTNPLVAGITQEYRMGIQMALDRINAVGGVKGRRVRLAFRDDGFDAARSLDQVNELVETEKIVALVGMIGTQPVMKLAKEKALEKHRMASVGPLTGLQAVLASPQVFPVRGSYEDEVRAMFVHSARLGRNRVLFLYYEAGVGPSLAPLVSEMARQTGVTLTGVQGFKVTPRIDDQRAAVLHELASAQSPPDAVILLAIGAVHSEGVKALRTRYGHGLPIYSLGQVNPGTLVSQVGIDAARGVMLTQVMPMPGRVDLPITRDFEVDRQRFARDAKPSYMFLEGYICGRLIVELMRKSKALTREAILETAESAGIVDVGGFRVEYNSSGRRSVNPIDLTMISRAGTLIR